MLKLLRKALQVGEATVKYPFQPVEVAPDFRGKPVYDFSRCIACGACAAACPPNAITMDSDLERGITSWRINYGRCIFCGRCEEVCPAGAIALSAEFELAAARKEDLYCRAEVRLSQCLSCGEYFAPSRQVAYVQAVLERAGWPESGHEGWEQLLKLCPQCRRRKAGSTVGTFGRAGKVLGGRR